MNGRKIKKRKRNSRIFLIVCTIILSLALLVVFKEFDSIIHQQRQLTIPSHFIANLETVPKLCPPQPRKSPHQLQCPKAVCVPIDRQAGLGHRLTNVLMGYILSLTLDIPLAGPRLEHHGNHHGDYPGADALFRLEEELVQCPVKGNEYENDALGNWTLLMLNSDEYSFDSFVFGTPETDGDGDGDGDATTTKSININSLPYGNPNLDFTGATNDGCDAIEELRTIVSNAECNTLFISGQFYVKTYLSAHEGLRSMYRGGEAQVANALLSTYLYKQDEFNIAFHIRDGGDLDANYKHMLYFHTIIDTILEEIAPTNIPVAIYIFSEGPEPHVIRMREAGAASGLEQVKVIGVDGDLLSPVESFIHFTNANVFIGSDSSFSWMVNYIAGGSMEPVVVATGTIGEEYTKSYSPGNLIGRLDGTIQPSGKIFAAAQKWKHSKRKGIFE